MRLHDRREDALVLEVPLDAEEPGLLLRVDHENVVDPGVFEPVHVEVGNVHAANPDGRIASFVGTTRSSSMHASGRSANTTLRGNSRSVTVKDASTAMPTVRCGGG